MEEGVGDIVTGGGDSRNFIERGDFFLGRVLGRATGVGTTRERVRRECRDGGRTDRGKDRSEGGEHGVTRIRWLVGGQKAGSSGTIEGEESGYRRLNDENS